MLNLLKQTAIFLSVNFTKGQFRYSFLIVNLIPIFLHLFLSFPAKDLINYFIIEAVAYCFMNILYIKVIDFSPTTVKFILLLLCIVLISLPVYFIPEWNKDEEIENRIAFWNYVAILFSFYTADFFLNADKFYDTEEYQLKRNVVIKFGILVLVAIVGTLTSKFIKSNIAFLLTIVIVKTIIDTVTLQKNSAEI